MTAFEEKIYQFRENFENLSERDKNKIAGIENDKTPEEQAAFDKEKLGTMKRLEEKGVFKKLDDIIKYRENRKMGKLKILYFDMDNVLVDFQSGIDKLSLATVKEYEGRLDEVPGIFSLMTPLSGAVEAVKSLSQYFDVYILSTAPWKNISAWSDKVAWIHKHFGDEKESVFHKRLIISHHKNLNKGDFLIDDRTKNGAGEFEGELIQFGTEKFPDWDKVTSYLIKKCAK